MKSLRFACVAVLILFSFGCERTGRSSPTDWGELRIGYLPIAAELPLFVAVEKGYFAEEGLEFSLTRMASSNDLTTAATADRIDILSGAALNVVLDAGGVSGKRHLLFALNPYANTPGHVTDHLIVRKNAGIGTVADLRGRKVASFPGSVRVLTRMILQQYGLAPESYEIVEMLPQDWQPSLQSGAIDAVAALEPNATQILKDSVGVSLLPGFYARLMPNLPLSGHWISSDFHRRAPQPQLIAFLNAYDRAIQFTRDHPDEAKQFLVKYAGVRVDILPSVQLNPWQTRSEFDLAQLQRYVDLLANNGGLQARDSVAKYLLVDPRRR